LEGFVAGGILVVFAELEADIHTAGSGNGLNDGTTRRINGCGLVRRHVGDNVDVTGDQFRNAGRGFGDRAPDQRLEVRRTQGEAFNLFQRHVVIRHPFNELVGAGTNGGLGGFFQRQGFIRVLTVDVHFGQQTEADGLVTVGQDGDMQVIIDTRSLIPHRRQNEASRVTGELVVRVGGTFKAVSHIFGGQCLTVMASQAFIQGERPFLTIFGNAVFICQIGLNRTVIRNFVQCSPDMPKDIRL